MKKHYPKKLKKAVFALSFASLAAGTPAALAAPVHDASGNIWGAVKDKSGGVKKSGGAENSPQSEAEKPAEPAPEKDGGGFAPEEKLHKTLPDKAALEEGLRPSFVYISFSGGGFARAPKAKAAARRGGRLGAAKRAEILGAAPLRRFAPLSSRAYPRAEIVSYHPSLIIGQRPYSGLIHKLALKYDMPEDLIHAIVHTESNYNYRLRGGVGEIGLMQIRPETARMLGFTGSARALYNPAVNLEYGTRYLALARYLSGGSLCGTVLKYNAGHGATHMNSVSYRYCQNVNRYLHAVGYRY